MRKLILLVLVVGAATAAIIHTTAAIAADGAPPVPHGLAGYEKCLSCHGAQGIRPEPANHAAYDEISCVTCHSSSSTPAPALAPAPSSSPAVSSGNGYCLSCHGQTGLSMTFTDGETLPLYIEQNVVDASVHGHSNLLCTDCHRSITTYPHPVLKIASLREYNIAQYELCKSCHFANYTKTLDSMHFQVLASGNLNAPLCTDCHGAHNVILPSELRTRISQTCAKCHQDIYKVYADSVHGQALIGENNSDVPVCTDCHQAHSIENPTTAAFRIKSVELCSKCHGNAALMQKYGLSTNVVKSYLSDFHGRAVALSGEQNKDIWPQEAVCTDCHGVHDIQKVDNPNSPVIKANLVQTCRKCHPDATANFPSAWLSHYEPSLYKAPLVFLARWFYKILIPFILVGLLIHILIDLWRIITNR